MQNIQSATQPELDRITEEVATLWKMSYVVCSGIIREYLVRIGATNIIPSPVLFAPEAFAPITEEIVTTPLVVSEAFIEALTTAVQHILPAQELEEEPELVEEQITTEQVAVTVEEDPKPCIPNVPLSADPTEKTTKSERIKQMFDQGMSVGKISRELKSNYSYVWAVVDTHKAVKARLAAEQEAAAQ